MGRVSADRADWARRVELSERLNATVITDLKTGATFPTLHKLHPHPPGLFITSEAGQAIAEADVVLSLDWVDLGGSLRQAGAGRWPKASIIQCSLDQYIHNGWSMDYQALPPAEVSMLAAPDRLVTKLLETLPAGAPAARMTKAKPEAGWDEKAALRADHISIEALGHVTVATLADHNPSYIRLPIGWPGECCRFADPLDYIGYDGGGGIGSGPGMAVGAALALRGSGRLPVAIIGDGDYLMGLTALWTGVHCRVPVLIIVANNQSFFNDELHQERVARQRGRPVENRSIGLKMGDPPLDLAVLAEGQGAMGLGPVTTPKELKKALLSAIAKVRGGATCVVDVHVAPEYARATSHALLRQIPSSG